MARTNPIQFLQQVEQPQRALERGEADLLIIPENFCSPDHPLDQLFEDRFVCVVWRESALAQGELTRARYVQARHVCMCPPDGSLPVFDTWLANDHGVTREISLNMPGTPGGGQRPPQRLDAIEAEIESVRRDRVHADSRIPGQRARIGTCLSR